MSFMRRLNNMGTRIDPCETPAEILLGMEYVPFTGTER